MPDVRETNLTFHGRPVIQVDEFFFVHSGLNPVLVGVQEGWLSEQSSNYIHGGSIYTRQDHTPEQFSQFPSRNYWLANRAAELGVPEQAPEPEGIRLYCELEVPSPVELRVSSTDTLPMGATTAERRAALLESLRQSGEAIMAQFDSRMALYDA